MEDQLRELREVEERLLKERSECEALEAKIRSFAFDPKFSSASKAPAAISDTTSDGNEHTPPPPPPPPRLVETVTPNARSSIQDDDGRNESDEEAEEGTDGGHTTNEDNDGSHKSSGVSSLRGTLVPKVKPVRLGSNRPAQPARRPPQQLAWGTTGMGVGHRFKTPSEILPGPGAYRPLTTFDQKVVSPGDSQPKRRQAAGNTKGPDVAISIEDALAHGLVTETDVDVGQFVQRHALSPPVVTELLELLQRVIPRSAGEEEPFALNHVALKSRLAAVQGFSHGLSGRNSSSSSASTDSSLARERKLRQEAVTLRKTAQREHDVLKQYNLQLQQENQRLREALETGKPRAARDASQAVVDDASVALMNIRKTLADCGPVFQSAGAASKLVTLQTMVLSLETVISRRPVPAPAPAPPPRPPVTDLGSPVFVSARLHQSAGPPSAASEPDLADHDGFSVSVGRPSTEPLLSAIANSLPGRAEPTEQERLKALYGLSPDSGKRITSPLRRLLQSDDSSPTGAAAEPASTEQAPAPSADADSPAEAPEMQTVVDVLRRIFTSFTTFGDRLNTQTMTEFKFYKLMRFANVEGPSMSEQQIEMIFASAASKSQSALPLFDGAKRSGATPGGRRLSFDDFILALSDMATRKYGPSLTTQDAFKKLFREHFGPLKEKLASGSPLMARRERSPAGRSAAASIGALPITSDTEERKAFLDRVCQPDVLSFFNDNKESLYALFIRFAQDDAPPGALAWSVIRDSNVTMSEKEFVKFCSCLGITPHKASRPEVVAIFKRATQQFADEGIEEALTYPEFLEVMAAVAEAAYKHESVPSTLFQKLQMLFFHMSDSGFDFHKRELKVFQSVRRAVKATIMNICLNQFYNRVRAHYRDSARERMQQDSIKAQQALDQKVSELKGVLFERA